MGLHQASSVSVSRNTNPRTENKDSYGCFEVQGGHAHKRVEKTAEQMGHCPIYERRIPHTTFAKLENALEEDVCPLLTEFILFHIYPFRRYLC